MIKAIVTDIEGTTSSISFVKDVLFPYARAHLPDYVRQNEKFIEKILEEVRKEEDDFNLSTEDVIETLLRWIDEDRKITPLKSLQGLIWKAGYEAGSFEGHIYDDALQALQDWHKVGIKLYVYSSGSVAAQKLLFSHTFKGDVTALFSGYFDTTIGPKFEQGSYIKIAEAINLPAAEILFLSDHIGEISAANVAGFQTVLVDREGKNKNRQTIQSFSEISLQEIAA